MSALPSIVAILRMQQHICTIVAKRDVLRGYLFLMTLQDQLNNQNMKKKNGSIVFHSDIPHIHTMYLQCWACYLKK